MVNLSFNLKYLRLKLSYSQQKISNILQISRNTYARYETGKQTPPLWIIIKITDVFNIPIDFLLKHNIEKEGGLLTSENITYTD